MGEQGYNTNLAAEFYVLSVLHRLGLTATLTLGNKKGVDVIVLRGEGDAITIEVKGLAGRTSWPVNNLGGTKANHAFVFVSFLGKITDPTVSPEVYVVPSHCVSEFVYEHQSGRRFVPLGRLRQGGAKYRNAWRLLTNA